MAAMLKQEVPADKMKRYQDWLSKGVPQKEVALAMKMEGFDPDVIFNPKPKIPQKPIEMILPPMPNGKVPPPTPPRKIINKDFKSDRDVIGNLPPFPPRNASFETFDVKPPEVPPKVSNKYRDAVPTGPPLPPKPRNNKDDDDSTISGYSDLDDYGELASDATGYVSPEPKALRNMVNQANNVPMSTEEPEEEVRDTLRKKTEEDLLDEDERLLEALMRPTGIPVEPYKPVLKSQTPPPIPPKQASNPLTESFDAPPLPSRDNGPPPMPARNITSPPPVPVRERPALPPRRVSRQPAEDAKAKIAAKDPFEIIRKTKNTRGTKMGTRPRPGKDTRAPPTLPKNFSTAAPSPFPTAGPGPKEVDVLNPTEMKKRVQRATEVLKKKRSDKQVEALDEENIFDILMSTQQKKLSKNIPMSPIEPHVERKASISEPTKGSSKQNFNLKRFYSQNNGIEDNNKSKSNGKDREPSAVDHRWTDTSV